MSNIVFNTGDKSYSGKLQFWDRPKKVWVESTLVLYISDQSFLSYTSPLFGIGLLHIPKKNKIPLGPLMSIDKMAPFENKNKHLMVLRDKYSKIPPIFATQSSEDLDKWIDIIKFACGRVLAAKIHPHPLSVVNAKSKRCNFCNNKNSDVGCEYCDNFFACRSCYSATQELHSLDEPRHYKPANHQHVMSYFSSFDADWFGAQHNSGYTCQTCHVKYDTTTELFHCLDCNDYNECVKCVWHKNAKDVTAKNPQELVLNQGLLAKVLQIHQGRYTLNATASNCPTKMSVITGKCWDLKEIEQKPAPAAYFEVKFHSFDELKRVGIGIGNQIFVQHDLLGFQQNSFAWYNNNQICYNSPRNQEDTFTRFRPGDTVGAGILYDSFNTRLLYFTKNGKFVASYPAAIPKAMDCFPGVTFSKNSDVSFSVNFIGPFAFDTSTILDYRHDKNCYIDQLPSEILAVILSQSIAGQLSSLKQQQSVCRSWSQLLANDNSVWSRIFLERWPHQNPNLKIKSWKKFYADRAKAVRGQAEYNTIPIENCVFQFQCPLVWSMLEPVSNEATTRYCNKCEKQVYRVTTAEQLQSHVSQGHCVSFSKLSAEDEALERLLANEQPIELLGMIRTFDVDDL
jgi:hypothetical protein